MYYSYIGVDIVLLKINVELIFVTGPAKRDQVGTKYTISQNGTFVECCVQYLHSLRCTMLPMKLSIDGENCTYTGLVAH